MFIEIKMLVVKFSRNNLWPVEKSFLCFAHHYQHVYQGKQLFFEAVVCVHVQMRMNVPGYLVPAALSMSITFIQLK